MSARRTRKPPAPKARKQKRRATGSRARPVGDADVITERVGPRRTRRSEKDALALRRAREVLAAHKDRLMAIPGVRSVEISRKVRGGEVTDLFAITVHVGAKIAPALVPSGQKIPPVLDGVAVDVQAVTFRASGCAPVAASLRKPRPALVGGLSVGDAGTGSAATIAAMARASDGQSIVGLTAGHAVADGGVITQPAGGAAAHAIGRVIDTEVSELMDAAVFQIDPQRRPAAGGVAGMGGPRKIGTVSSATDFVPVVMAGSCTGWVYGKARRIAGPVQVDYGQGPTELMDQILVYAVPAGRPFNLPGDSGAMLLSADGAEALGVVIAALIDESDGSGTGLATPIDRVLARFGISLLQAKV